MAYRSPQEIRARYGLDADKDEERKKYQSTIAPTAPAAPSGSGNSAIRERYGLGAPVRTQQDDGDDYGLGIFAAFRRGLERSFAMGDVAMNDYEELAEHYQNMKQWQMSPEDAAKFEELRDTEGFWRKAGGLMKNPRLVMQVVAESLPMMAGPIAGAVGGGIAGGAAGSAVPVVGTAAGTIAGSMAGGGVGSFFTEYFNAMGDFMQEQGVNPEDPAQLKAAFENDTLMAQAKDFAFDRGIPIAVFDALSMGLAGRIGKPIATATRKVAGRSLGAGGVSEVAMQATFGAAGEAGAQLSSTGEIHDELDVLLEGFAEIVPGVFEAGVSRYLDGRNLKKKGLLDPEESPLAALDKAEAKELPISATDIDPVTGKPVPRATEFEIDPETGEQIPVSNVNEELGYPADQDALDIQLEDGLADLKMGLEGEAMSKEAQLAAEAKEIEAQGSRNRQMLDLESQRDTQLARQKRPAMSVDELSDIAEAEGIYETALENMKARREKGGHWVYEGEERVWRDFTPKQLTILDAAITKTEDALDRLKVRKEYELSRDAKKIREEEAAYNQRELQAAEEAPGAAESEMVSPEGIGVEGEPVDVVGGQQTRDEGQILSGGEVNPAGGRPLTGSLGEALRGAGIVVPDDEGPTGGGGAPVTPQRGPDVTPAEARAAETLEADTEALEERAAIREADQPAEPEPTYDEIPYEPLVDENAGFDALMREVQPGGGVAIVPDQNYQVGESDPRNADGTPQVPTVRTPSTNPSWFQSIVANEGVGMVYVQNAIDKHKAGKNLGAKQKRIIEAMQGEIEDRNRPPAEVSQIDTPMTRAQNAVDKAEKNIAEGTASKTRVSDENDLAEVEELLSDRGWKGDPLNERSSPWDSGIINEYFKGGNTILIREEITRGPGVGGYFLETRPSDSGVPSLTEQAATPEPEQGEQLDMMPEPTGRDAQVAQDERQRGREAAAPEADMGVGGDIFTGTSAESIQAAELEASQTDVEDAARDVESTTVEDLYKKLDDGGTLTEEEATAVEVEDHRKFVEKLRATNDPTDSLVADIEDQHENWRQEVIETDWVGLDSDEIAQNNTRIDRLAEMGDKRASQLVQDADHWMNKTPITAKSNHERFQYSRKANKYGWVQGTTISRDKISFETDGLSWTVPYDTLSFKTLEDQARMDRILEVIEKVDGSPGTGSGTTTPPTTPPKTAAEIKKLLNKIEERLGPMRNTGKRRQIDIDDINEIISTLEATKLNKPQTARFERLKESVKIVDALPEKQDTSPTGEFVIDEDKFNEEGPDTNERVFSATIDKKNRVAIDTRLKREGAPYLTPEEADARVTEWEEHAIEQGKLTRKAKHGEINDNSNKVIISLFDTTGVWGNPYALAGYDVRALDINVGVDVTEFSTQYMYDMFDEFDGKEIYGVLAACPCTTFSNSSTRWRKDRHENDDPVESRKWIEKMWGTAAAEAKNEDGTYAYATPHDYAIALVHKTMQTLEYYRPQFWAIENPEGRIETAAGLPDTWRTGFQPHNFGEPYTKRTLLWGNFDENLPTANVDPVEGSKMHKMSPSEGRQAARAETPEGFAYAFFMANNFLDMDPVERTKKDYWYVAGAVEQAMEAGVTEEQIRKNVYLDLAFEPDEATVDDAKQTLRDLIEGKTPPSPLSWEPPPNTPAPTTPEPEAAPSGVVSEIKISTMGEVKGITQTRLNRIAENLTKFPEIKEDIAGRLGIKIGLDTIWISENDGVVRINSVDRSGASRGGPNTSVPSEYSSKKVTHLKEAVIALDQLLKDKLKYQAPAAKEIVPGNTVEMLGHTIRLQDRPDLKDNNAVYGEIARTKGADGDPVDVFVSKKAEKDWTGDVYVVDQYIDNVFDEHKAMLGYNNLIDARRSYRKAYGTDWAKDGVVTKMTVDEFNKWLKEPSGNPASRSNVTEAGRKAREKSNKDLKYSVGKDLTNAPTEAWLKEVLKGGSERMGDIPDTLPLNIAVSELLDMQAQREGAPAAPATPSYGEVEAAIKPVEDRMPGAPITLLHNYKQAPKGIVKAMQAEGMTEVPAVYDPNSNTIYMFSDKIKTIDEGVRAALHEKTHQGLHEAFGPALEPLLKDIYKNAVIERQADMQEIQDNYGFDRNKAQDQLMMAEELLTHMAENEPQHGMVKRAIAFIRKLLREMGIVQKFTDTDLISIIKEAQGAVSRRQTSQLTTDTMIEEEVMVEDTGEIFIVEQSANDLIASVNKRAEICKKVRACL